MNGLMLASGVLAAGTALVHLVAGQIDPVRPPLAASMTETSKRTLHACWHVVSVGLVLAAAVLLYLVLAAAVLLYLAWAKDAGAAVPRLIAAHFLAYGLVFIVMGLASAGPRGLVRLPPLGAAAAGDDPRVGGDRLGTGAWAWTWTSNA